jgi:hypothetical protein
VAGRAIMGCLGLSPSGCPISIAGSTESTGSTGSTEFWECRELGVLEVLRVLGVLSRWPRGTLAGPGDGVTDLAAALVVVLGRLQTALVVLL